MKYLVFSDLHGDAFAARILIDQFEKLHCDGMICLGDVLYHGPRNDLPVGYYPKKVIELLNAYSNKIICIKGNCDAEVDQMVLSFPLHQILDISLNGFSCHLEHGHHLNIDSVSSKIIFSGHTHICSIEEKDNKLLLNPGSIAIPKNGTPPSFMIFDEKGIFLYDKENHLLKQYLF